MRPQMRTNLTTTRVVTALALIAASMTLYQSTRPGLLFGLTPDVSVYLGAAVRLTHGTVLYRDFVFVQPPGFVILTAPLGLLSQLIGTRNALAILRLLMPLLAAANVLLVGRLARHRGTAATTAACTLMACFPAELYAIRGPQLEPIVTFFSLLGAVLVFDRDTFAGSSRRLVAGGVAFGVAAAVKLPALIPIALLLLLSVPALRRRSLRFAGGVVGGLAVPMLPFVILAPAAFWQDVLTTQVARIPTGGRVPVVTRLGELTGLSQLGSPRFIVIGVCTALVAFVIAAFAVSRRRPTTLEWFALGSSLAVGVAQFAPAQYYPQYAALMAPFISLLLGLTVARATEAFRRRTTVLALTGLACAGLLGAQFWYTGGESAPDPATFVDAVIPPGACTLSNSPVYLFTANRFESNVAGCSNLTDPAGTFLALGLTSADAVATWRDAFGHADYVLTDGPITRWLLPEGAQVPEYVSRSFRLVRSGSLFIYVRNGFPASG